MSHSERNATAGRSSAAAPAKLLPGSLPTKDAQQLQREIGQLKTELSELARRSAEEQDAGRRSIARELHDNFGQFLTVLDMELAAVLTQPGTPAGLRERLTRLRTMAREAHRDVDRIAGECRPPSLEGHGLQDAFTKLLEEWSKRSGLVFDLHVALPAQGVPAMLATVLYRCLQEAVTNVARHANATRVGVILQSWPKELVMIVEDDGVGFDGEQTGGASMARLGLIGMRERLSLAGGSLEIESETGKGTTLLIRVPL